MRIVIINGPNINLQGLRETQFYGTMTYQELIDGVSAHAQKNNVEMRWFQSNHEGTLLDIIQSCRDKYDGIIINAAAYSHTSIAILDALLAVDLPTIEVHLSDVSTRENFRKVSYLKHACIACFQGEGLLSYLKAIDHLIEVLDQ